jgi:Methyltransferase domain
MTDALRVYVRGGHKKVDGWLSAIAVDATLNLAVVQKRMGIRGAATEIGIHEGRFFVLLQLLTEPPEMSVAWDLFEHQQENVDKSGRGDKDSFTANLARHGCDLSRVRIYSINSINLTPERLLAECKSKVRLFSVDGGHSAKSTCNDLALAAASLCEGGLIFLDDFFKADWPGVAEGACEYLLSHKGVLHPIAIVGNKFIFTNTETMAKRYLQALSNSYQRSHCFVKKSVVFGGETLTITPYGAPQGHFIDRILDFGTNTKMWRSIRYTATGKFLKLMLRQFKDVS